MWQWRHLLQLMKPESVGARERVTHPHYPSLEINWGQDAAFLGMSEEDLYGLYEKASDPMTPSSELAAIYLSFTNPKKRPYARDAILAAMAQNPNASLELLTALYGSYPSAVRSNVSLSLLMLEDPSLSATRVFGEPLWELYQIGNELFNSDGRNPISFVVIEKIRELELLGYQRENILQLGEILEKGGSKYGKSSCNKLCTYWDWLDTWSHGEDRPQWGHTGIGYALAYRHTLPDLVLGDAPLSADTAVSTANTQHTGIRHVNSPQGNFPLLFLQNLKFYTQLAAKECQCKVTDLVPIAVQVSMEEIQPLCTLGEVIGGFSGWVGGETQAALRGALPNERIVKDEKLIRAAKAQLKKRERHG